MKPKALALVLGAVFFTGCEKPASEVPVANSWFIESYRDGVIAVEHEGKEYKAKCDSSTSYIPATSFAPRIDGTTSNRCDLVGTLVGRNIQPFETNQKDSNGWTMKMWIAGNVLILRKCHGESSPCSEEEFMTTAVTKEEDK